eukprot:g32296.t1
MMLSFLLFLCTDARRTFASWGTPTSTPAPLVSGQSWGASWGAPPTTTTTTTESPPLPLIPNQPEHASWGVPMESTSAPVSPLESEQTAPLFLYKQATTVPNTATAEVVVFQYYEDGACEQEGQALLPIGLWLPHAGTPDLVLVGECHLKAAVANELMLYQFTRTKTCGKTTVTEIFNRRAADFTCTVMSEELAEEMEAMGLQRDEENEEEEEEEVKAVS